MLMADCDLIQGVAKKDNDSHLRLASASTRMLLLLRVAIGTSLLTIRD
jgi:hypothetical protein